MFLNTPEPLIIKKTENSPEINFDILSQKLVITGESRPENPDEFYAPVIKWINDLDALWQPYMAGLADKKPVLKFELYYFNSTSSKSITDIILAVKKLILKGYPFSMEWHYDQQDPDMLEAGKEFSETFGVNLTFVAS